MGVYFNFNFFAKLQDSQTPPSEEAPSSAPLELRSKIHSPTSWLVAAQRLETIVTGVSLPPALRNFDLNLKQGNLTEAAKHFIHWYDETLKEAGLAHVPLDPEIDWHRQVVIATLDHSQEPYGILKLWQRLGFVETSLESAVLCGFWKAARLPGLRSLAKVLNPRTPFEEAQLAYREILSAAEALPAEIRSSLRASLKEAYRRALWQGALLALDRTSVHLNPEEFLFKAGLRVPYARIEDLMSTLAYYDPTKNFIRKNIGQLVQEFGIPNEDGILEVKYRQAVDLFEELARTRLGMEPRFSQRGAIALLELRDEFWKLYHSDQLDIGTKKLVYTRIQQLNRLDAQYLGMKSPYVPKFQWGLQADEVKAYAAAVQEGDLNGGLRVILSEVIQEGYQFHFTERHFLRNFLQAAHRSGATPEEGLYLLLDFLQESRLMTRQGMSNLTAPSLRHQNVVNQLEEFFRQLPDFSEKPSVLSNLNRTLGASSQWLIPLDDALCSLYERLAGQYKRAAEATAYESYTSIVPDAKRVSSSLVLKAAEYEYIARSHRVIRLARDNRGILERIQSSTLERFPPVQKIAKEIAEKIMLAESPISELPKGRILGADFENHGYESDLPIKALPGKPASAGTSLGAIEEEPQIPNFDAIQADIEARAAQSLPKGSGASRVPAARAASEAKLSAELVQASEVKTSLPAHSTSGMSLGLRFFVGGLGALSLVLIPSLQEEAQALSEDPGLPLRTKVAAESRPWLTGMTGILSLGLAFSGRGNPARVLSHVLGVAGVVFSAVEGDHQFNLSPSQDENLSSKIQNRYHWSDLGYGLVKGLSGLAGYGAGLFGAGFASGYLTATATTTAAVTPAGWIVLGFSLLGGGIFYLAGDLGGKSNRKQAWAEDVVEKLTPYIQDRLKPISEEAKKMIQESLGNAESAPYVDEEAVFFLLEKLKEADLLKQIDWRDDPLMGLVRDRCYEGLIAEHESWLERFGPEGAAALIYFGMQSPETGKRQYAYEVYLSKVGDSEAVLQKFFENYQIPEHHQFQLAVPALEDFIERVTSSN